MYVAQLEYTAQCCILNIVYLTKKQDRLTDVKSNFPLTSSLPTTGTGGGIIEPPESVWSVPA